MKDKITSFFRSLQPKIANFMYGRYGADSFSKFLVIAFLVLYTLTLFIPGALSGFFTIVALAMLFFAYYRIFSKNIYRRRSENEKYLRYKQQMTDRFRLSKEKWNQRKEYKFFMCPSCKATMRVPRGKGKVRIVCRKCGSSFIGKT